MDDAVIDLLALTKIYHSRAPRAAPHEAVRDLSLKVLPGQVIAFLGPNGAGKTTTINLLMGFLNPTSGCVRLFGRSPKEHQVKARIGYLPEHFAFYPFLTGLELLDSLARLFKISAGHRSQRIEYLLTTFSLWDARNVKVGKYSRGMTQRLGMAQTLLNEPELLILDEPTTGFDALGRKQLLALFGELKTRGVSIFLSSHILSEVEAVSEHVAILNRGRLILQGPMQEVLGSSGRHVITFLDSTGEVLRKLTAPNLKVERSGMEIKVFADNLDIAQVVLDTVRGNGGVLLTFTPVRKTLEDIFCEVLDNHQSRCVNDTDSREELRGPGGSPI